MSSTYGESLKLSIFGQSHGPAIGMTLDGIPAGLPVNIDKLQEFMSRRAPGQNKWSTPRKEPDNIEFLSGITNGYTCGAPIAAIIRNTNQRSSDYNTIFDHPRPGHADYTAHVKYGGYEDVSGGGHFSGRITAPLCIAGGLCMQWLEAKNIQIGAHILNIHNIFDTAFDPISPQLSGISKEFPVLSKESASEMQNLIASIHASQDSVGGSIECAITGLPAGLGEPMFGGMESRIAQIVYGIPAVKCLSFGDGANVSMMNGSENNDCYTIKDGKVETLSNHCGGILGGITNGMPLIFTVSIKPTPSIGKPQKTVSLSKMQPTEMTVQGRHDPCIVPRAVPVIEAASAIAVFDAFLSDTNRR